MTAAVTTAFRISFPTTTPEMKAKRIYAEANCNQDLKGCCSAATVEYMMWWVHKSRDGENALCTVQIRWTAFVSFHLESGHSGQFDSSLSLQRGSISYWQTISGANKTHWLQPFASHFLSYASTFTTHALPLHHGRAGTGKGRVRRDFF